MQLYSMILMRTGQGVITPKELREGLERLLDKCFHEDEFALALGLRPHRSGEISSRACPSSMVIEPSDNLSGLPTDEEMEAAKSHAWALLCTQDWQTEACEQWDQIWSGGIEGMESAEAKPLFDENVHTTRSASRP